MTIMGYNKHELSTKNMLYSLKKKIVILHPCLLTTATFFCPKVAIAERFDFGFVTVTYSSSHS